MTAQEELARRIERDSICRAVQKKIDEGRADFTDTARYTDRAAELLGMVLSEYVPDMPPDERETLCKALLRQRYLDTNAMLNAVQRALDNAQGLHLAPQIADYPEERVEQAAHALADETVPVETIVRRAKSAPATIARSFHDDYIEKNAAFRDSAGLKCYITRIAAGGCCKWCTAMAGRYSYGEEPEDVYRRHDNCSCSVTYENGRKRQDVWSKRTWEAPEPGAGAGEPVVFTAEQAAALQAGKDLTILPKSSIIKSIDVDDYDTVTYGKGISPEVSKVILDTMKQCEKSGGFVISEISTQISLPENEKEKKHQNKPDSEKKKEKKKERIPVLQIEPLPNGLLRLNINAEFLSGKTLDEVNERFASAESTVVNSLEEAVIHESGHAISIVGKSLEEIRALYQELKGKGLDGISEIARNDGAECLAELEVLRFRGTRVTNEAAAFYKKYMRRNYS